MRRTDDLRDIIETALPAYATHVAGFLRDSSWDGNWFRGEGENRPDYSKGMRLNVWRGPNREEKAQYSYFPILQSGEVEKRANISFKNLRIVGVQAMEFGDLDISPLGESRRIGLRYRNNSPTGFDLRRRKQTESEDEKERGSESESSFSKTVETMVKASVSSSVGGSFCGVEAKVEIAAEAGRRAEKNSSRSWRQSDRLRSMLRTTLETEATYEVLPYHLFSMTAEEAFKDIRQDVWITGQLEADIRIWSDGAQQEALCPNWLSFGELENIFRGVSAETPLHEWYANRRLECVSDETLEKIERPSATLCLSIKGHRSRITDVAIDQTPLRDAQGNALSVPDSDIEWENL